MIKTLVMDPETREMRVRYADCWRGQHEVTEYRVIGHRYQPEPVRNRPELDGLAVHGTVPGLYVKRPAGTGQAPVWCEEIQAGPTVKTPCPGTQRRPCEHGGRA